MSIGASPQAVGDAEGAVVVEHEDVDWYEHPHALYMGGNDVRLLRGGDALFPAMCTAISLARHEVWLATYIFHHADDAARCVADALAGAARRGVLVNVVVDGFGSKAGLATINQWWQGSGVRLAVFRPVHSWLSVFQPGQLRRLHQKLCVVDGKVGFVGGINIIEDRLDIRHGLSDRPRLDFAVEVRGPVVRPMAQTARAMWSRAAFGRDWREQVRQLARSSRPLARARTLIHRLRMTDRGAPQAAGPLEPMVAAFLVRDNVRQRRAIERSYIEAFRNARRRIDLMTPYFYPGSIFRRTLHDAARRGVQVRLVLQGKVDYRIAALAARSTYAELLARGVRVYEYTPAFLHAKVALVDDQWATVGSSNIDPLSLLLNLEANVVVRDAGFSQELSRQFDAAVADSLEITMPGLGRGWWGVLQRGLVAWCAYVYMRVAGLTGRY